ncbi:translesion error-prone DNA polymerase V autoproteolytic subunit [Vibrio vulnificus]|nr:translesion error-prone DNA polymerase V autoproteolytic subunit [Vibrio vulnificus]
MNILITSANAGITGFQSPAAEYSKRSCSLEELLIEHPSSTFLAKASGDSMEGVGIFDGDILIVDRSVKERDGDVVIATYNGEFICKIIDTKAKLLISANPNMRPVKVSDLDSFIIEGVVIRSVRCHRPSYVFGSH